MKRLFVILGLLIGHLSCQQEVDTAKSVAEKPSPQIQMEDAMTRAIEDYIVLVKKEQGITMDSIFFGKHQYGQSDDFPDVTLPSKISGCKIHVVSMASGEQHQQKFPKSYYINLFSNLSPTTAEFIFVTFYDGFKHQFDYTLRYTIDSTGIHPKSHQINDFRTTSNG